MTLPDAAIVDPALPLWCTATAPHVAACTTVGDKADAVDHDWRVYRTAGLSGPVFRCVWCHVVACGNVGSHDPCMRPYHHRTGHRSLTGVQWPLGGNRP